jgi:hypothetical protein
LLPDLFVKIADGSPVSFVHGRVYGGHYAIGRLVITHGGRLDMHDALFATAVVDAVNAHR